MADHTMAYNTNSPEKYRNLQINKDHQKLEGNTINSHNIEIPDSDSGEDSENTYRTYSDNVDTDVSNTQDEGDAPSPPVARSDRCILNNLNIVSSMTSSDSDSCTDGEFILDRGGQTTDETTSTSSESDETQIWVPVANRNGTRTSGSTSTPPLPSLTSSNASDSRSPSNKNNTIPRYSPREMSSSGNASNLTSPAGTGDETTLDRDRRHSWHEIQEEQRRVSARNISLLRHDPRTGNTETVLVENYTAYPNGDSGIGPDEIVHSNSDELFYPESPSNISLSILKKRNCRYRDGDIPCDATLMDSLFIIISGLYAMALVVLGTVIPIADTYSSDSVPLLFQGFYVYIYTVSIAFLVYAYVFLLQNKTLRTRRRNRNNSLSESSRALKRKYSFDSSRTYHTGSFYLRLGAVGFGIGSMIKSGLHFGEFFDTDFSSHCNTILNAVNPLLHLCFTFIQLYFIFLNSKMCIHRYKTIARFGLMHMVATNLCVWVENVVRETLRDIQILEGPKGHNNGSLVIDKDEVNLTVTSSDGCSKSSLMKGVIEMSSPYLYPCSIEYSLICAGILYVMWKNIGKQGLTREEVDRDLEAKAKVQRLNVDCTSSSRGLFLGIFILVGTVITMITFFVLIKSEEYTDIAIKLEHLSEVIVYVVTSIAVILAFHRMQALRFHFDKKIDLEETLILISLSGVYLFGFFSIVAGALNQKYSGMLIILSSVLGVFQASLQTVFLMYGMRKSPWKREHERQKLGREFVTFLLVCNIALWGVDAFEILRSQANPVQLEFFGVVAWTIINHISIPLAIFFRFHSTVCFANIWKNAWKRRFFSHN